ncbi:YadA-like family protein [Salmonella enterica]|uniref:YadA-like family protein n=1 Tax=Salmonella enterica TaxID=28901 RepID=UPI000CDBD72A|nr:YadA-like family protein [Salmonella enterica]AUX95741.1 hemagglutinin [Salmonella enterica subsp. enterica serovar Senftenberg]QBY74022.1 hemagglutinin [Salmonella enterica subsp. enterica serovar Senftenberg]QBY83284.1 hemagglutinin [Salmonella enterica subsp. enterica serovar Senftenberg]QCC13824.1 hemagglutinin [Salmonella enterica subsp. enterica serovar Senftenberg]
MNRIFRVLWNAATGTFVVTSETAKSRGKKSGRRKLAVSALISLSSIMVSADALANAGNDTGKGIGTENGWIAIGEGAEADSTITTKEKVAEDPSKGYVAGAGIAIGYYSKASGASSTALGGYSLAESIGSVALGAGAHTTSTAKYSMAVGTNAVASNLYAIALGTNANASGKNSIALGRDTVSSAERSLTVGLGANAASLDSMAFGYNTSVTSDAANGIAFGSGAVTSAKNSVAIGSNSTATEENVVSVGSDALKRKIVNVGNGAISESSTDAVNGSQLFATNANVTQNTTDIAANTDSINQNTTDIATNTTNINSLSDSVTTLTDDALLWDAASGAFSAKHNGSDSKLTNLAAGTLAADSTDAVNGSQLFDTNEKVDKNTADIATNTNSINQNTTDIATNTTSINNLSDSITTLTDDALLWDAASGTFSANHNGSDSKITNLAAGTLASDSTDAVNGSQLFATNENVSQNTTDIAANTTSINQNTTDIATNTTSINNLSNSVTTLTDDALLWDAVSGAFSANRNGSASKIINVAAGDLSEDSTDAVNGSQLYETNQRVDQNTSAIADINTSITNLGTDALSWDDEEGAFSASHGTSGTNKITNVAAGEIASDSTDAVNGSQLYETNMLISQYNESISQLAGDTSETYITENGTGVKYIRTNDNGLEGQDAYATGNGATAVGYEAVASGAGSLALGQNSSSTIDGSIALGSGSTSNRAITTGIRETSVTSDGVVIGYNTTDRELLGALSLGTDGESYRQITNVADGSEAQDAVTVRQLQNAIGAVTTTPTKYYHANSTEEDSLAVGTDSLAMGAKTIVNADAGIGIGLNTLVMADAINGIAIGSNARANHANSIAMGNGSQTTRGAQTDYTAYNMDTPQNSVGEFSVGSEDGQRQITNVAAGSADTDAVNVGQLKVTDSRVAANTESINNLNTQVSSLDTRVTNIENGIGDIVTTGSTKYFKTNTDGVDANAQGADSVAIGSGSIAAAENSVALGTNSVADEANTVSVGSSTQQRRITNVAAGVNNTDAVNVAQLKASEAGSVRYETNADGSVNYSVLNLGDGSGGTTRIGNVSAAVNDTDAVNYAQLKRSVEEANTYTDQKMGEMNSKIKGVENKMSGGIASAMAMAGLPQAYAPGANMTSIAGGTFNGESAVAIGVSMVSESGGWVYKLQGTSNSQGDYSAAIGAGFQW